MYFSSAITTAFLLASQVSASKLDISSMEPCTKTAAAAAVQSPGPMDYPLKEASDMPMSMVSSMYGTKAHSMAMSAGAMNTMYPGAAMSTAVAAAAPASSGSAQVQVVKVSNAAGALTFSPSDIQAAVGTFVQFQFWPKNHSIVQSNFANPCVPINSIQANITGFFSGFMPVAADATTRPTFTIPITDTKPIWFYCSQGKHCQAGMVGAINAAATGPKTFAAYAELAKAAPANVSPSTVPIGGVHVDPSKVGAGAGSSSLAAAVPAASTGFVMSASPATDGSASATSTDGPLQATANTAAHRRVGVLGLGLAALAAGLML